MTTETFESLPIEVPVCDPHFDPLCSGRETMPFNRSLAINGTGVTSPREIVNLQTAFLDASQLYGHTAERARSLRTFADGKLRLDASELLPSNHQSQATDDEALDSTPMIFMRSGSQSEESMRRSGDPRANQNPVLMSLMDAFPSWVGDDELLYQEARHRVIALHQKITIFEYIPALLGLALPVYQGYKPELQPSTDLFFSTAAFRYGHDAINSVIPRLNARGSEAVDGNMLLRDVLFSSNEAMEDDNFEALFRGLVRSRPQAVDGTMVDDLRNFMFGTPSGTTDVAELCCQNLKQAIDDLDSLPV